VNFTPRTPRVVAARRLQRRKDRDQTGRFLAEGPQAVREALAVGAVRELFGTDAALARHADLAARAGTVSPVTDEAIAALAETVQPQGLVAVCDQIDVPLGDALANAPRLVAVAAGIRDPGNAGTVLRTADAAGAGTVVFAGDAVDPYNGKCVRASAGSLFHVDVVRDRSAAAVVSARTACSPRRTEGSECRSTAARRALTWRPPQRSACMLQRERNDRSPADETWADEIWADEDPDVYPARWSRARGLTLFARTSLTGGRRLSRASVH
jgi:hypothetical protein